jgi:hypothetical protein
MARGRDLAGLAALAGLAYMANKKGKETTGVDPDAISPEDAAMGARGNAEMARMAALDNPDFEPGMYTKEPGGDSAPAPARAAPTRSAAKAPAAAPVRTPGNRDLEKGVSRGSGAGRASRYDYSNEGRGKERLILGNTTGSTEEGMKGYVPRRTPKPLTEVRRPGTRVNYENADTSDMAYKKGGKTKKMASGGMTSASKRADGIASRGKTKCKMY